MAMSARSQTENVRPGDLLLVVHEFQARSPDELSLARGDRVELIERDDDFGDGWFLGKNTETGDSGLFPEVYTRPVPKPTLTAALHQRAPSQPAAQSAQHVLQPVDVDAAPTSAPLPLTDSNDAAPYESASSTQPLQIAPSTSVTQAATASRSSISAQPRSIGQTLSGDAPREEEPTISSPVMHETLSVIDEHITDMSTPRHSATGKELRPVPSNDSGSEYSSHHRLSYINGHETEEEEHNLHTEQEVINWSPARVAEYLEDVGVEKKHCDIFKEQEINGEALLGMDQATIFLKEFELGPVGPRLRTWVKIKALQQEVKNAKDAAKAMAAFDGQEESALDPTARTRATSMSAVLPRIPSLRDGPAMKSMHGKQPLPRAHSTAGHSMLPPVEVTSPLAQFSPTSPTAGTPTRPSAASVRSLNHNRRHSSIDSTMNMPTPTSAGGMKLPPVISASHKKTPSFDRGWVMGSPQSDTRRPSSSHYGVPGSPDENGFGRRESGISQMTAADLDRGYFSGGEVDNRKSRNVLRKRESPSHSRNPSFRTEDGRRATYNRRHSRIGSADSATGGASSVSAAAKAYFGNSIKTHRSSSNFDFVRPLKPTNDGPPTVTKLPDYDSPSIDAIANSPRVPGSEASSLGRASPSPAAAPTQSHSFFSKKARGIGLRAISDAVTGTERANVSSGDITASPIKESPLHSPTRTGSSTPSGTSNSLEIPDLNKRSTGISVSKDGRKKAKKHSTSAYLRGRQQITPQEAMEGCDYSGWMKKKSSSLMTTWKTRLFVLRGRRLSYFYTENDTEEKGLIDISSHRVLPANNERITGFHATITRAASSPSSPQGATIPTAASAASNNGIEEDMAGMFIFKLVPPRAGLQRGVQFTKPIVHYFAVDSIQAGRLWMAALMKATIDRDDSLSITTTYQQKTISLEKARAMRQRPPALMDDDDTENASIDMDSKQSTKESIQESVIHEEDEKQGLAISGLDDAKALLEYAENGADPEPQLPPKSPPTVESPPSPEAEHKRKPSFTPGLVSIG
ncbi:uncharacterized protein CC84DRAFT_268915 [Paraphaeosphaeria sporulosa]|uniref:Polarized growth protein Boi2 n=1 Tax=Paraphaeosphaeria sporulosa TaxID=1460663 RepID=A0A177BZS2_9PLEO|nr:uncharacterized protein CC84DRAFT_268915 [Paraphaeosphaeria sporulosa]OAG00873.1 hypothetical protein CC84DRAFT_268915 [Paraphaeosphaeria sporulosa]